MIEQFFNLVSIGLHLVLAHKGYAQLCSHLSENDWLRIKTTSEKQGVAAIVLDGISILGTSFGYDLVAQSVDKNWWKLFFLKWVGSTQLVEDRNQQQTMVLDELSKKWADNGIQVMVFKGQANGLMYPTPNHRSPGDIDCYLFGQYTEANEVARKAGATVDEGWYKHSEIIYKGELFENHLFL